MIGLFHIYIFFFNIERNFTEYVHIDRGVIDRYEIIIKHLNIYVF